MCLKELIESLEARDPNQKVPIGFHRPHSYRGDYHELAFEPKADVTVGDMLSCARSALGATFQGWKGGEFTMGEYTGCYLAERGETGEGIGPVLLDYMFGNV